MANLPLAARLYVSGVIGAGALLLVLCTPWTTGLTQPSLFLFFSLLLVSALAAAFKVGVPLARNESTMSLSYAVDFAALLLIGPDLTMLIGALSAWTQCTIRLREPNPVHKTLFSITSVVITVQAAGRTFDAMHGALGAHWLAAVLTVAVTITVYFLVNSALVAGALALSQRRSLRSLWRRAFLWSAPGYYFGGAVAACAAFLVDRSSQYFVFLAAIPLYLTYRAYQMYVAHVEEEQKHAEDMSNLNLTTVEALALAIAAKDQRSHVHMRRMQVYAAALGRRLGMTPQEIEGLRTAALLHDVGKLAVPEHILSKPGALTEDETRKVRLHPIVGAEIIAQVPFPFPVAPLILCHHEQWDGRGYPAGLKGEDIPLGARVLGVLDRYSAWITDRPYHPAMTPEAAAQALRQESGKAFDPRVAAAFLEVLPDLPGILDHSPSLLTPKVIEGLVPHATAPTPHLLEDIALAHREIYGLYEIAQVMGTSLGIQETMREIAPKLNTLVPYSCMALYLCNEDHETLTCRFATGTDAEIVRRIVVRNGHGMTGWVVRNRKPLINAKPSADLEASEEAITATSLQSALVSPLITSDQVIGTLAVYHGDAGFYTDDHSRLMERVCEQAAAVIANSVVFERTQQESLTDALTGLPNTRHLLMTLDRELARAERLKSEVAFIVMDLDEFKEINDRFGHQVGDRALQRVAQVLRAATRPYDICVRYAGDEFIIVLPGCPADEADTRLRELQSAIEAVRFEARPGRVMDLSMSAGAAIYPMDGVGYDSLLAIADARMYRDKTRRKKGRVRPAVGADQDGASSGLSETDLRRAALGIL